MKDSTKKILHNTLSLVLIFLILIFIIKHRDKIKYINMENIKSFISSKGKYAILFFIIIYALKPLILVIPSSIMTIIGGTLFGPVIGFILSMTGFFLSGTIAFFLAKKLGKPFVDKVIKDRNINIKGNMEKNGFLIVFLFRFPPIFHYDVLSYIFGLSKVKYMDFIIASLLGVIIETVCYSYMGENIFQPGSHKFIVPLIIVVIVTVIGIYANKKTFNSK